MPFRQLIVVSCLAVSCAGHAAEVQPLPPADCQSLMGQFAKATGVELKTREGPVSTAPEASLLPEKTTGNGCLGAGKAKGLKQSFFKVEARLKAVLGGWEEKPEQQADGPGSSSQGFARGKQHVIFSLTTEPPTGTCENVVQADCKVPRKRWTWTLSATAYQE